MTEAHEKAPDLTEPVVGFRSWEIGPFGLLGPYSRVTWKPTNEAKCITMWPGQQQERKGEDHPAPAPGCRCGLYAYWTPPWSSHQVIGAVVLSGRLQIHRHGMRAERAKVVALLASPEAQQHFGMDELQRLADQYDAPLAANRIELEQIALRHGQPLPDHLKPPPIHHAPPEKVGLLSALRLVAAHRLRHAFFR